MLGAVQPMRTLGGQSAHTILDMASLKHLHVREDIDDFDASLVFVMI
jgi:hypothetical protein